MDQNSGFILDGVYNKGDKDSISDKEIQELLNKYGN